MDTVEIRKLAKTSIKGKHFKACVIFLIYVLFCMVISMVPFVGSIATLVLSFPLSYSLISTMMKLKNDENVGYFDFISTAFSDFGNAWKVAFSMLGKLWPYLLGYFLGTIILVFCVTFYLIFSIGSSIIYNNSDDELWISLKKVSDKQYNDYYDACVEKGFDVARFSNPFRCDMQLFLF